MSDVIPAVLAKSAEELKRSVAALPQTQLLHLDVLETDVWAPIGRNFEAHLMVEDPDSIMNRWCDRGAKAIIVHKITPAIRNFKPIVRLGLGVELDKPLEEVWPNVDEVHFIHLMSIAEIGAQGRPLDERIFDRIKAVREKFPFKTISIDGGIDASNYERLIELGADKLVVGSHFNEVWSRYKPRSQFK